MKTEDKTRRSALGLAAALLAGVMGFSPAQASDADKFPTRPITMIVPFAAGGAADATARIVAEGMGKALGGSIIIENVGGAGGAIGTARVKGAEPNGYTLGIGHMGTLAAIVPLMPKLAYNPLKDFTYLGLVSESPNVVYVRKDFPAKSLEEFIVYARQNKQKLTMGHGGIGAASHVTCVMLFQLIGVEPSLVAYRGFGQTVSDIMSGNIDGGCDLLASVSGQAQAGNLRVLAIAADERSPLLPDAPTSREAGLPTFKTSTWTGLFVPRGTPDAIIQKLSAALETALADPAVGTRLAGVGASLPKPDERGGTYMQKLVEQEVASWTKILSAANIQLKE